MYARQKVGIPVCRVRCFPLRAGTGIPEEGVRHPGARWDIPWYPWVTRRVFCNLGASLHDSNGNIPFGDTKSETERESSSPSSSGPCSLGRDPYELQICARNNTPFGRATGLFSGDWRQVGPVIPFGTPKDVVDVAFISSYLWKHVQRFRLASLNPCETA